MIVIDAWSILQLVAIVGAFLITCFVVRWLYIVYREERDREHERKMRDGPPPGSWKGPYR